MKKIILSSSVIFSFIVYAIIARTIQVKQLPSLTQKPKPTATPLLTSTPTPDPTDTTTPTPAQQGQYKDGNYTGDAANAFYGNIQVQVAITNGKITNVTFLQAPGDRSTSIYINQQADPILAQEAIQSQSAQVDVVSGATDSSDAFIQSMQSALNQAK